MKFWRYMNADMKLWFCVGWLCLFCLIVVHLIRPQDFWSQLWLILGAGVSFLTVMFEGNYHLSRRVN